MKKKVTFNDTNQIDQNVDIIQRARENIYSEEMKNIERDDKVLRQTFETNSAQNSPKVSRADVHASLQNLYPSVNYVPLPQEYFRTNPYAYGQREQIIIDQPMSEILQHARDKERN